MNIVFGGGLWPIGQLVGFVEAPYGEAVAAMRRWMDRLGERRSERDLTEAPILEHLSALAPLEAPWTRELLVETTSRWTAHLSNSIDGGDSWPRVSYLANEVFSSHWVVASHTPAEQYPYPATQLWLGGPEGEPPLRYVRTISAGVFDSSRWEFEATGVEQPWETPEHYRARLVRDRFTRRMLIGYLAALDLHPDDPDFYRHGFLFESRQLRRPRRLTIEEARAEQTQGGQDRSSARP